MTDMILINVNQHSYKSPNSSELLKNIGRGKVDSIKDVKSEMFKGLYNVNVKRLLSPSDAYYNGIITFDVFTHKSLMRVEQRDAILKLLASIEMLKLSKDNTQKFILKKLLTDQLRVISPNKKIMKKLKLRVSQLLKNPMIIV